MPAAQSGRAFADALLTRLISRRGGASLLGVSLGVCDGGRSVTPRKHCLDSSLVGTAGAAAATVARNWRQMCGQLPVQGYKPAGQRGVRMPLCKTDSTAFGFNSITRHTMRTTRLTWDNRPAGRSSGVRCCPEPHGCLCRVDPLNLLTRHQRQPHRRHPRRR
jgi:hypothetical protein